MSFNSQESLAALLWSAATAMPDKPAIVDDEGVHSYAALRDLASNLAAQLLDADVEPGDRVAILLERSVLSAAAIFGAYAAGAVAVTVNDRLQPRQIEYLLEQCDARVLVTNAAVREKHVRRLDTRTAILECDGVAGIGRRVSPLHRETADFAHIIYTSGSSGQPKGVTFTHGAMRAGVDTCRAYLGIVASDRVGSVLPFSSIYGLNQLLTTVAAGAALVIERSALAQDIGRHLREREVSVLAGVPPFWLQLLAAPSFADDPPPRLRILQNAGGHLPVHAARSLLQLFPHSRLFLQYGQTETFRSSFLDPSEVDCHPDSIGRAVPGAEIRVVRHDGDLCEIGEQGELVFRGPSVASGYWNDAARTVTVFRPCSPTRDASDHGKPWVWSGDIVTRDAGGRLYFVGRAERIIKTLGFKVGPDEIVDVLLASGEVREAQVTSAPDVARGECVVAHVVLREGGTKSRLMGFCRSEMPRYMVPSRVELYDQLPRLAGGKYDLGALRP